MSSHLPHDDINPFRNRFRIPVKNGRAQIYFLGNSLGLQPVATSSAINKILEQWGEYGVEGFFRGDDPWMYFHDQLTAPLSRIVGSLPAEIVVMNQLTVNLHLLMTSFYRPEGKKKKIVCEAKAFPSDQYMLETHLRFRGLDPADTIIEVHPREGEYHIRTEDILTTITEHKEQIALLFLGGVNYYTGQLFDIEQLTQAAHDAGAIAGFDLAHAAGNVELKLHNWNVDFASWCTYKYLNAGPGAVAAAFVHERYHHDTSLPRLAGWWGYRQNERFMMHTGFSPEKNAQGWQVSTPSPMLYAALKVSLDIFEEAGMDNLVKCGRQLSDYLVHQLHDINTQHDRHVLEVITPADKGCQVSILILNNARRVFDQLQHEGIFADWREPGVIRVAPVPLYNTLEEVRQFIQTLAKLIA